MQNIKFLMFNFLLMVVLVLSNCRGVYAIGDGNIDSGGGNMGGDINGSSWVVGNEGVRITIITTDGSIVTSPIDFTNKHPDAMLVHFNKISKLQYNNGYNISPSMNGYTYNNPDVPQVMYIYVSIRDKDDIEVNSSIITANIVDLSENEPPNPLPDDRNDSFTTPRLPNNKQKTYATWSKWIPTFKDENEVWYFSWESYVAYLSAEMEIVPDEKSPTAIEDTMKSGYGINIKVNTNVTTYSSDDVTDAQTAITYFPEFEYETYWRLLERTTEGYFSEFELKEMKIL